MINGAIFGFDHTGAEETSFTGSLLVYWCFVFSGSIEYRTTVMTDGWLLASGFWLRWASLTLQARESDVSCFVLCSIVFFSYSFLLCFLCTISHLSVSLSRLESRVPPVRLGTIIRTCGIDICVSQRFGFRFFFWFWDTQQTRDALII